MRYSVAALLAFMMLSCRPSRPTAAAILSDCPDAVPGCIEMLLDAPSLAAILRAESPMDSIGHSELTLAVDGHFESAEVGSHILRFRAFRDGIACSAFGQGNAAVVGYGAAGEPILLTTAGAFTVAHSGLTAGCKDCLKVRGSAAAFPTPSWDLVLTGHKPEQFAFLKTGEPVLKNDSGCIVLAGRFAHVSASECGARLDPDREPEVRNGACT